MEEHIRLDKTSAADGRFSTDRVPLIRLFFDRAQSNRCRRLVVMAAAQSAKTQNVINFILWSVVEDPAPTMWVMASMESMREFRMKRIDPIVSDCAPVWEKAPKLREGSTRGLLPFTTMNLIFRGSRSPIGLKSDAVRRTICDERNEWPQGAIDRLRKRLRTFHNSQEISIGTAGNENDELHTDWLAGSQTIIHFRCLHCQHSQPFRFGLKESVLFPEARARGGIRYNDKLIPEPGGDWEPFLKSVRYECESCGHMYLPHEKFALIKTVHEHHRRPDALPKFPTMHWNALAMPWESCSWDEIAKEFVQAMAAMGIGNIEPLRTFVQDTLGEPWREVRGQKAEEGEILKRCGGYMLGESLQGQSIKLLGVDVQKGYLVATLRQLTPTRESRLLAATRILDFDQLVEFQNDHGVQDDAVFMDSAYGDQSVPEDDNKALEACWNHGHLVGNNWVGWNPMIGHKAVEFSKQVAGKTIKVHWKVEFKTLGPGRFIQRYQWSKPHYRERFFLGTLNGDGPLWTLPQNPPRDYLHQLQTTERIRIIDPVTGVVSTKYKERGRHDYSDCEIMLEVAADVYGIGTA